MKSRDIFDMDSLSLDQVISEDTEFIPLMTHDDEDNMEKEEVPETLAILPLRNTVLFPGVVIPITAGRDKSIQLLQQANKDKTLIGVVSQKDGNNEDPGKEDIYGVGTVARIVRMFKMPDGNTTVIIQGKKRFEVEEVTEEEPYMKARVTILTEKKVRKDNQKFAALIDSIKDMALKIIKESPNIPSEAAFALKNIESDTFLLNFISSNMNLDVDAKQELLEIRDMKERANMVLKHLHDELRMLEMKNEIQSKVKTEFDQQQREYFLHQQMKQIQEELGGNTSEEEIEEMRARAEKKKWPDNIKEVFEKELKKIQRINPQVPEFSIQRNYLEFMLDLPWNEYSKDTFDLAKAEKILDRDHYGLEKVKERILEHLAVLKLKGDMKAPILCLYGPPGVGKTSLGKSVAEALGREYIRMSLGGMRDEAEIRGHRKTYIGAMPGRLIQSIKKAGTSNPVFVLDEIDKLASGGGHGDPQSAMLEVLDPEQNSEFYDNYLELGYDLSKVMFIATANNLSSIHPALRDRMEIIEINGYTVEEKVEIAKRHLLPKQLKEHGIKPKDLSADKKVLEYIVDNYTRESGVRGLDKVMAKVARYAAKNVAMEKDYIKKLKVSDVKEVLGPERFNKDKYQGNDIAGVVTGLAWTPVGGAILFIESSLSKGKGKLTVTGNLGDVMKESAIIAMAYLKAHADEFNINYNLFDQWDVHIHFPEGATPKDGPSAGITILTSLASLFAQKQVREKTAMTGEITLRGKVLPVGGIKEKILAAKRADIQNIILCEDNRKDIEEIRADYLEGLNFHYVENMMDVIKFALTDKPVKNAIDMSDKRPIGLKQA
ncbi:endopeptidase La [Owenweeksia hongkongensis]|uniref:Lon protease n=1 Tax=Owenweeksia hongkongensis (strain DSM 17368 / CIP 108786 / JCM 12287 / NRRL B-23963 / UST20020801) TaxID=926562 RepID=G8QZD6_OWEHD|nr:endopeptidase La [Owenweeksia hongkongensis]AEV32564.1 ATP-dependent protease La [Owenweeksia hongkongensis DSM 17368]